MPRSRSQTKEDIVLRAMEQFWCHGYQGTSMADLVDVTGASRHAIYSEFGGKHELFINCFPVYQQEVVTPAFSVVEEVGADLDSVANYFQIQISQAVERGLPGPGCLVANTMAELSQDQASMIQVRLHHRRLQLGFYRVLAAQNVKSDPQSSLELHRLAEMMVVFTQGLWSFSQSVTHAEPLYCSVKTFLNLIQGSLSP